MKYTKELAEYFKIPGEQITINFSKVKENLRKDWIGFGKDNDEFHRSSKWIIFRMMRDRPKVAMNLQEIITLSYARGDKKIVDYGAGVGSYTIPLSMLGFDITAFEISDSTIIDFLKWRIDKRYLNVRVFGHKDLQLPLKTEDKVDAIILYDVLEHLDKPFELIKKMHNLLKSQGMLYLTYSSHGDEMSNMKEIEDECIPFLNKHFYRFDSHKWLHK